MEKQNQMTATYKAQLSGKMSEMLKNATSNGDERIEILQAAVNFCEGLYQLIIDRQMLLSLFVKNQ